MRIKIRQLHDSFAGFRFTRTQTDHLALRVDLDPDRQRLPVIELEITHQELIVLQRLITVECTFTHRVILREGIKPAIQKSKRLAAVKIGFDIHGIIENHSRRIPDVGRGVELQYASRTDSPRREGLPEVLILLPQAEPVPGRVEQPGNAERGVGQEAGQLNTAAGEFRLKQATQKAAREFKIIGQIVDRIHCRTRHDAAVNRPDRPIDPVEEKISHIENRAVESLDGIFSPHVGTDRSPG
ncbi:hypothetical protein SDC9_127888 [bioreactor metagenome]|uniref:Uncharacterized protein n=1 Tax=bioreactor metagenome TaxID=1076179 RepID=A0A645CV97_9ZZZZ